MVIVGAGVFFHALADAWHLTDLQAGQGVGSPGVCEHPVFPLLWVRAGKEAGLFRKVVGGVVYFCLFLLLVGMAFLLLCETSG